MLKIFQYIKSNEYLRVVLVLLVLFILQWLIISPINEFPLNDDWAHTLTIFEFDKTGDFFYPPWLSSNLHVPIVFGIILVKIFSFSFSLLRISNLILAFVAIFLFYFLLRKNNVSPGNSFGASMLLWVNPIFFYLSYTFLGDICALLSLLLALILYYLGFKDNNQWLVFFAGIVCVFGFYTRQTAILIILAALIYSFYYKKFKLTKSLWLFGIPLLLIGLIYLILNYFNVLPGQVEARFLSHGVSYSKTIINNLWNFLILLSFFLLPLTLSVFVKNLNWIKDKVFWLILVVIGPLSIWAFYTGNVFPNLGNILNLTGFAPSSEVMQGEVLIWGSKIVYFILNLIIILGVSINVFIISKHVKAIIKKNKLVLIFGSLYLILILPIYSFDRYLLLLLPVVILVFFKLLEKIDYSKIVFVVLLVAMLLYGAVGTYNYLEWNKARWELGRELLNQGVEAKDIDGGYEFNGWYLYKQTRTNPLGDFTPKWAPWYINELYPGHLMKYIISFSPLGGYEVISKDKVTGVFSNIDYIYVNKVNPGTI